MEVKLIATDSLVSLYIENKSANQLYLQAFEDVTDNIGHCYRYDLPMPYNKFIDDDLVKKAIKFRQEINDISSNFDALDIFYAIDEYCYEKHIKTPYNVTEIKNINNIKFYE